MKHVRAQYVAMLREKAGISEETITTEAGTAAELFMEVSRRHGWDFSVTSLRVAINDRMAGWSNPLCDGDCVLFLPPSSGG